MDLFVQDLLSHVLMITRRIRVRIQCIALCCSEAKSVSSGFSQALTASADVRLVDSQYSNSSPSTDVVRVSLLTDILLEKTQMMKCLNVTFSCIETAMGEQESASECCPYQLILM